jgi:hypothetical protein
MSPRQCSLGGTLLKDVFIRVARGLVRLAEPAKKSHAVALSPIRRRYFQRERDRTDERRRAKGIVRRPRGFQRAEGRVGFAELTPLRSSRYGHGTFASSTAVPPPSQDGDTRAPVLINFPASDHAVF